VNTPADIEPFSDRDEHLASVIKREVLDRGRRALICDSSFHVMHAPPDNAGGAGVAQIATADR
jgi:hypothetical protein